MDYFNKEEFQQLKNLPRSASKKSATMDRIRTSSSKSPRNYPVKYVITSIAVILLATLLISPEFFSPTEQANAVSQLNKLLAEKDEEIKCFEELYETKIAELSNAIKSIEMVRWSAMARLDDYSHSFYNLENIYKVHSNYDIQDDWYVIQDDYFEIELLQYENAKRVDFYTFRQESDEGINLVFSDTDPTDGWIYTNSDIGKIINKHNYNYYSNGATFEPYFVIYAEVTLEDGSVVRTPKLPIYNK